MNNLKNLVATLGVPLAVIDLETTTFRGKPNFGITEVGVFGVGVSGVCVMGAQRINPEAKISPEVMELTGITDKDVADKKNWAEHPAGARFFERFGPVAIVSGFNIRAFDLPAMIEMAIKYKVPVPKFPRVLDLMDVATDMAGRKVKLAEFAEGLDVYPSGALHGALVDSELTAKALEAVIGQKGVDYVAGFIKPLKLSAAMQKKVDEAMKEEWATATSAFQPVVVEDSGPGKVVTLAQCVADEVKPAAVDSIVAMIRAAGIYDLQSLVEQTKLKPFDLSMKVAGLFDAGELDIEMLEDSEVQVKLQPVLATHADYFEENGSKLKPVFEKVKHIPGVDYIQLRVGLHRLGLCWTSKAF